MCTRLPTELYVVLCAGRCPRDAEAVLLGQRTIIKSCSIGLLFTLYLTVFPLAFLPVLLSSRYTLNKVVLLGTKPSVSPESLDFPSEKGGRAGGDADICSASPCIDSRKQLRFYSSEGYLRDKPSSRPPRQLFHLQDMYIRQTGAFLSPPLPVPRQIRIRCSQR